MKIRKPRGLRRPPVLYGACLLAVLSLVWSAYAITDLMRSGWFGLSVAVAGDIGWITVLWAEYRDVTVRIQGRTVNASIAGWAIAAGVAVLLALHGHEANSLAQTIAGPFVVLVGKAVWAFALAALRDPAALTAEQLDEIHSVRRDSEYTARLHSAQLDHVEREADAEIARIRAEARVTLARDEADFQITLERADMRSAIERRSRIAIAPIEPPSTPIGASQAPAPSSTSTDREQPSIAELAREHVAITTDNRTAVDGVLAARPDAERESVAAAVRRARNKMNGGYA
ncbi:hypothetical protein ACWEFL_02705 [Streptomyces sp. NPDC004838]